jgi:hypothetical protein
MRCIAAVFIHRLLTRDQMQWHVNVCLELREKANKDPTFRSISRIITGDESWIYDYHQETKQRSSQWKSPQSPIAKKAWQVQSSTKSMLIVFSTWRDSSWICPYWHYSQLWLLLWCFETLERKCVTRKTRILAQPQLATSSWQRACPHVPENHRVCD